MLNRAMRTGDRGAW